MEDIKVRSLRYNEIPEIIRLHEESIIPIWRRLKRPYNLKSIESYIRNNFSKEKIFVLEKNGKIIASGSIMHDKFSGIKKMDIVMMLVSKKEQKKGYGKAILQFLENYAKKRGAGRVALDVLVKNPAVKFYKHLGYKEHKLIMEKKL